MGLYGSAETAPIAKNVVSQPALHGILQMQYRIHLNPGIFR